MEPPTDATNLDDPMVELERLRELVGPSEVAYEALRRDRDAASDLARQAMAETGELRATIEEQSVQLSRARQDQDVLLRQAAMPSWDRTKDRIVRRWHTSVAPRLARLDPRRSDPS